MAKSKKKQSSQNQSSQNQSQKGKASLDQYKMEAASEVGVNLDNADGKLTAKQAGKVGGRMVKNIVEDAKNSKKKSSK